MRVFYDSSIFSRQTFGGISRYIVDLINNLPSDVHPMLGIRASDNIYLDELKKEELTSRCAISPTTRNSAEQ